MKKSPHFVDSDNVMDVSACLCLTVFFAASAKAILTANAYLDLGDPGFLTVTAFLYLISSALTEARRWAPIWAEPRPWVPARLALEGWPHRIVLAGWPLVFGLLWAAQRRNPSLKVPLEFYALAAKTLAVAGCSWLSRNWRARSFQAARRRWQSGLAALGLADRILGFLPENVGMPIGEIARRLGVSQPLGPALPAALDGLIEEGLIERFSKTGREAEPMYRFSPGQAKRLGVAGSLGLAALSNEDPRWRVESLSVRQLVRSLSCREYELTEGQFRRAMRRLDRRGLVRRLARPGGKVIRREDRYAITELGRRVVRCARGIGGFLPYFENGRTMSFSEIAGRCTETPEVVRAALDYEKDLGLCEEFADGPEDANPRFWSTVDKDAVYRWVGTWQDKLAKQVN